jgi:phosphoribulokinase
LNGEPIEFDFSTVFIVAPGGRKMEVAMQLVLTPLILKLPAGRAK